MITSNSSTGSGNHRVLKSYIERQKLNNTKENNSPAINSKETSKESEEQNELARVFARIKLGRRNTVIGETMLQDSESKQSEEVKKSSVDEAIVPVDRVEAVESSDPTISELTSSLGDNLDDEYDSVFDPSESLSSFSTPNVVTTTSSARPCDEDYSIYSDMSSSVLPHSTDLDEDPFTADTLRSSLDSFQDVEKLNGQKLNEVVERIDKVIKELDHDGDKTLTDHSLSMNHEATSEQDELDIEDGYIFIIKITSNVS